MGRKPVPQPLSLGDPQTGSGLHAHIGSGPSSNRSNSHGSAVSPGALTSSAPNSSTLGSQGHRSPHIAGASAADTTLHVAAAAATPASSRSPRSPRSPYSKFNTTTKQADTRQVHTSHGQSPSQLQPKFTPEVPLLDYKLGPVTDALDPADYRSPRPSPRLNLPEGRSGSQGQHTLTHSRSHTDGAKPHKPNFNLQREEEKHTRSASRFWNFNKPKPAGHQRENTLDFQRTREAAPSQRPNDGNSSSSEAMSRGSDHPIPSDRVPSKASKYSDNSVEQSKTSQASRSDLSLPESETASSRKGKPKQFTLLGRNRSLKEDHSGLSDMQSEVRIQEPDRTHAAAGQQPLRTAPVDKDNLNDRHLRHMKNSSSSRNNSADRQRDNPNRDLRPDKDHSQNRSHPSSFKDNSGSTFFGNLKSSGSRAADMFSSRLFGNKGSRSASTTERENTVDDEHYQLKVINLPLVQQARKTRISKRLEDARDKTEFWMPAFPWRAIDYLNYKGSDVEGLYRVPGSGPQIKKWQRKFDEKHDVDLFAQDDLYDINIIGSMLKAWLRELPDELFPKESQERIARECSGAESVPEMLIDELSNLPPYNYYLLFAITCHLSLLLAHSEKNRMDFRNLCICFQPCLKIDAFCFKFLVCEWRDCWKGCKNEAFYIEEEYALMQQPPPPSLTGGGLKSPAKNGGNGSPTRGSSNASRARSDRDLAAGDQGSRPGAQGYEQDQGQRLHKVPSAQNGSINSISTGLSVGSQQEAATRDGRELRPLSPIKPLSPLGF